MSDVTLFWGTGSITHQFSLSFFAQQAFFIFGASPLCRCHVVISEKKEYNDFRQLTREKVVNMSGNLKKEDLRILRTKKVLLAALFKLLELKNFNQITVNDLCEEAMVSRTAFYSHFIDKYDLLEYFLTDIKSKIAVRNYSYEEAEKLVNNFANNHKMVIKNLIEADREASALLCDFLLPLLKISKNNDKQNNPNEIFISNFCCGGLLKYLLWQVENNFPTDIQPMNPYIYNVIKGFQQHVC